MRSMIAIALALAGSTAALAAPTQTAPPAASPATETAAQRLVLLYLPADRTIAGARAAFRGTFGASFDATPANATLEGRFPGLRAAAMAAGEAELEAIYRAAMPGVQRDVAARLANRFSAAELAQITAFFTSPAGQATLDSIGDSPALANRMARQAKAGQPVTVTQEDLNAAVDPEAIAAMPTEHLQALMTFGTTPTGTKFQAEGTALAQLVAERTMAAVQAEQPRITQAISAAVAAHIGKAK